MTPSSVTPRNVRRLYLSGPITGTIGGNRAAFEDVRGALEAVGFTVVTPFDVNGADTDWDRCMARDLAALTQCDGMAQLDDWPHSRGARIENHHAFRQGKPVAHWRVWEREGAH